MIALKVFRITGVKCINFTLLVLNTIPVFIEFLSPCKPSTSDKRLAVILIQIDL